MSIAKYNAYGYISDCNGDFNKALKLVYKQYRKGILTRDEWVTISEIIISEREKSV